MDGWIDLCMCVCKENSHQSVEADQLCTQLSKLTTDHEALQNESAQVHLKLSQERVIHMQVSVFMLS